MLYLNIAPSIDLTPWVTGYHLMESEGPLVNVPGMASSRHTLTLCYGGTPQVEFRGQQSRVPDFGLQAPVSAPWTVILQGEVKFIAVELRTTTLYHLIRDSVSLIVNQAADILDFGFKTDNALMDNLRNPKTGPVEKIAAVEDYLRRIFTGLPDSPSIRPALMANLEQLKVRPYTNSDFEYSEAHLRREFLRHLGIAPHRYRDIARVKQACSYLAKSKSLSITRLAQELAFHDAPHFNRVFKRYAGLTPTQYRAQAGANPMDALNQN